jgi:hypothetical protein
VNKYRAELKVLFMLNFSNIYFFKFNFDESPCTNKKPKKPSAVASKNTVTVYEPPVNIMLGISICPCVASDGQHLSTAIILDKSFNLEVLNDHKSSDFR